MINLRCDDCGHEWQTANRRVLPAYVKCITCHHFQKGEQAVACYERAHPGKKGVVFIDELMVACPFCGTEREQGTLTGTFHCNICGKTTTRQKARRTWCEKVNGVAIKEERPGPRPPPVMKRSWTITKEKPVRKVGALSMDQKREIAKRWVSWDGSIFEFLEREGLDYELLNHLLKTMRGEFTDGELYGQEPQTVTVRYGT